MTRKDRNTQVQELIDMKSHFVRFIGAGLAAAILAGSAVPAFAQSSDSEARIRKLEAEVRALQRKVFPGGDGKFFEPQISGTAATPSTTNAPSTTAVTDILARLDALEAQLQRLTASSEEHGNNIRALDSRLTLLEGNGAASTPAVTTPSATSTNLSAMTGGAAPAARVEPRPVAATPTPTPAATRPAGPSAERLAAVQAIAKPQTDDAGDDEYSYGFRLWDAGYYPEAQQQLTMFVEKYPDHWRATYGRNLLGRAYLDDGKPGEAAPWFFKNYQADKTAARAPDSLLYLAESMIAQNDTKRACIALAEFGESYAALAAGRLQNQYEADRKKVKCN